MNASAAQTPTKGMSTNRSPQLMANSPLTTVAVNPSASERRTPTPSRRDGRIMPSSTPTPTPQTTGNTSFISPPLPPSGPFSPAHSRRSRSTAPGGAVELLSRHDGALSWSRLPQTVSCTQCNPGVTLRQRAHGGRSGSGSGFGGPRDLGGLRGPGDVAQHPGVGPAAIGDGVPAAAGSVQGGVVGEDPERPVADGVDHPARHLGGVEAAGDQRIEDGPDLGGVGR